MKSVSFSRKICAEEIVGNISWANLNWSKKYPSHPLRSHEVDMAYICSEDEHYPVTVPFYWQIGRAHV